MEIKLEHLKVLRLEPGDTLVITSPDDLSFEDAEYIRRQIAKIFPDNVVVMLTNGLELGVVRA